MMALDRLLQRWRIRMALPFIYEGDRLLDVGCYDRSLIDLALPRVAHAVGVDPGLDPSCDDRVELKRGIFPDDFDFGAMSFDCIAMLAVLEHVEDPDRLAAACARILSPGGRVVLTVPHRRVDTILEALMFLRLVDGMAAEEHHGFDVDQTRSVFEGAGLSLRTERRFQLGLNRLYVFERPNGPV